MLRAALGAVWIVSVFSVVRLMQSASLIVLFVELVVAAVAIAVSLAVYQRGLGNRMVVAALASLLAFAGLVF